MTTNLRKDQTTDFETQWKRRFESFASAMDDDAGIAGWSSTGLQTRVRYFSRFFGNKPVDGTWLDAGCGAGTYSRYLSSMKLKVYGFDYSMVTIQKARQRDHSKIHWGVADVKRLPIKDAAFEGSLCFGVTQALEDAQPAVEELHRVVKSGAEVWIDGLNSWCILHIIENIRRKLKGQAPHLRYESPWKLRSIMKTAGFKDVRIHWMVILPKQLAAFQKTFELPIMVWLVRNVPLLGPLLSHSMLLKGTRV